MSVYYDYEVVTRGVQGAGGAGGDDGAMESKLVRASHRVIFIMSRRNF